MLASHGDIVKASELPYSLNAGAGWQPFDLKQPRAKLRLKMQQMTICSPHSCRYCKHRPYLERREWQPVVSDDKTLKYIFTSFSFDGGGYVRLLFMTSFPQTSAELLWCRNSACAFCFPECDAEVLLNKSITPFTCKFKWKLDLGWI